MAAGLSYDNYKLPLSTFITLKIHTKTPIVLANTQLQPGKIDPYAIQSFTIEKLGDATGLYKSAEFKVSTAEAPSLERTLMSYMASSAANSKGNNTYGKVSFRYGIVNGVKSPLYIGQITGLSLSTDMYTLTIKVSFSVLQSMYSVFTAKTKKALKTKKYTRVSDLVKAIATGQGWKIGTITPTKRVNKKSITYPSGKEQPLSYINNKCLKGVVSTAGAGAYKAVFKYDAKGVLKFYYVPSSFFIKGGYSAGKNFNFVYNMGPSGNVISWQPTLNDGTAAVGAVYNAKDTSTGKTKKTKSSSSGGNKKSTKSTKKSSSKKKTTTTKKKSSSSSGKAGSIKSSNKNIYSVVTKDSKEVVSISYAVKDTKKTVKGAVNSGDKKVTTTVPTKVINVTAEDALNYAESVVKDNFSTYCYSVNMGAKAVMEIVGDPQLQVLDYINVLPMYTSRNGKGNVMHPSGGTYQITAITDSISGGKYTTTLTLVKQKTNMKLSDLSGIKKKKSTKKKSTSKSSSKKSSSSSSLKVGSVVNFKGGKVYVSSYKGAKGVTAKAGKVKITKINSKLLKTKGAHPYHVIHTDNNTKAYGWVGKDQLG